MIEERIEYHVHVRCDNCPAKGPEGGKPGAACGLPERRRTLVLRRLRGVSGGTRVVIGGPQHFLRQDDTARVEPSNDP